MTILESLTVASLGILIVAWVFQLGREIVRFIYSTRGW